MVAVALALVLCLYGALPFVAMPTLGQALWTTSFSQSIVNQSLLAVHAVNFGTPTPAPIAFGLSGAYPAAILIALGLNAANAYALVIASWLTVAFYGAWRLARQWGGTPTVASLGAVVWLSSPMVLGHAGYSMLSVGMALLPLYFFGVTGLLEARTMPPGPTAARRIAAFLVLCSISVFTDGYTFVMFAFGTGVWWTWQFLTLPASRRTLVWPVLPVIAVGFGLAYLLYVSYIGHDRFDTASIDFFRAWGVDLDYLVIPTRGFHGLFDLLGWSVERSEATQFGDLSVWATTFSLPLIAAALFALFRTRKPRAQAGGFLLIALLGFYLALGPSLKIHTVKPPLHEYGNAMPEELASIPTGSAWISEYVPGFNSMRSSYRWSALGLFGLWAIVMLWAAQRRGSGTAPAMLLLTITLLNAPDIQSNWQDQVGMHAMFEDLNAGLVVDIRKDLRPGESAVFLPYANDFLINYLAAASRIQAYNVGGNKNIELAMKAWPERLRNLPMDQLTNDLPTEIFKFLVEGEADVVVLPYFDTLWAAHFYPCLDLARDRLSLRTQAVVQRIPSFECPTELKERMAGPLGALAQMPEVVVQHHHLFSTVRLARRAGNPEDLLANFLRPLAYPIRTSSANTQSERVLWEGWHAPEPTHVWSTEMAELRLSTAPCAGKQCEVTLTLSVFDATPERPIEVKLRVPSANGEVRASIVATSQNAQTATISFPAVTPVQEVDIEVPDARSPAELRLSADPRRLGIALIGIDLKPIPPAPRG